MDYDFSVLRARKKGSPKCPGCKGNRTIDDPKLGVTLCPDCGTHISETILSMAPEWKNDEQMSRCNCIIDPMLKKMSMATRLIGVPHHISIVHNWHTLYSYKEHSLFKAFKKIEKVAQENNFSDAVNKYAQNLYALINPKDLKRGDSRTGIMAACLYYGCRARNIMRHEKEIAQCFKIQQKYINIGCDIIAEILFEKGMDAEKVLAPYDIFDYIEEYTNLLRLSETFKNRAIKIGNIANEHYSKLKNMPYSLAAGCIYYVAAESKKKKYNLTVLKQEMKEKCELSDVTIVKCYNNLSSLI